MAKVDKVDNKNQKEEKTSKKVIKSSYSKKKKIKKNILNGIAYVQSTFNNTIISIADENGNVLSWSSAGSKGFKGSSDKREPFGSKQGTAAPLATPCHANNTVRCNCLAMLCRYKKR